MKSHLVVYEEESVSNDHIRVGVGGSKMGLNFELQKEGNTAPCQPRNGTTLCQQGRGGQTRGREFGGVYKWCGQKIKERDPILNPITNKRVFHHSKRKSFTSRADSPPEGKG